MSKYFKILLILIMFNFVPKFGVCINNSDNFTYMITGGYRPKDLTLAKYIVSLRRRNEVIYGIGHVCAGSIIKPRVILTAAHCLSFWDSSGTEAIVAGEQNRFLKSPFSRKVFIKKKIKRKSSAFKLRDIGLVILEEELVFDNTTIEAIPLADSEFVPGTRCVTFGWGAIFMGGPLTANLVFANVELWPTEKCQKGRPFVYDGMICASEPGDTEVDSCSGDSGGPLICDGKLTGVVSMGMACAHPHHPGLYTDVYYYRDWIEENSAVTNHRYSISIWIWSSLVIIWYK